MAASKPSAERLRAAIAKRRPQHKFTQGEQLRAAKLLRAHLSPTQATDLVNGGSFKITGPLSGRKYTISAWRLGHLGLARAYNWDLGATQQPVADELLAAKLLIENDEQAFQALSCVYRFKDELGNPRDPINQRAAIYA